MVVSVKRTGILAAAALLFLNQPLAANDNVASTWEIADYLRGRAAILNQDFDLASESLDRLVEAHPDHPHFLGQALQSAIATGEFDRAIEFSRKLDATDPGKNDLAVNLLVATEILDGNIAGAIDRYEKSGIGLNDAFWRILRAWSHFEEGRFQDAELELTQAAEDDPLRSITQYHLALMMGVQGRHKEADEILVGISGPGARLPGSLAARIIQARTGFLIRQGLLEEAREISTFLPEPLPGLASEELKQLSAMLSGDGSADVDIASTAAEGISGFFAQVGETYRQNSDYSTALAYSRLAMFLDQDNIARRLEVADTLGGLESWTIAEREFARVPQSEPLHRYAAIGRANALHNLGRGDEAYGLLENLAGSGNNSINLQMEIGELSWLDLDYERALGAYNAAVELVETEHAVLPGEAPADNPASDTWLPYYLRAITYFDLDRWEEAKSDFRTAVEMSGENPYVLNYLGYSLADRNESLEEAEQLIVKAVNQMPENGAFVDSLGWVFYRQGRFEESLEQMELAIKLEPLDPVVMDHLGDVYWQVGRKREARFHWNRALSYDNEITDEELIRQKLETGLEGAAQP